MTPNMKNWIKSLRAGTFPEHLIDDETQFALFEDRIYASHPMHPPVVYDVKKGEWSVIDFSQPPDKLMPRYKEFIKDIGSQS